MITRLTKIQLIIFAIVTVLGGAFVGGRYANLDRLFIDRSYPVTADFKDSGGIFAGAEVTYRGIAVGKVGRLEFTDSGVRATLDIENDAPKISDDVKALVANKSAIGEQFVDLQPQSNSSPYLRSGSNIPLSRTNVPIDTTKILLDASAFVSSVDTESLKTLVNELGIAFAGNGRDLTIILDTMTSFIQTADDNFDVTRSLIRSSSSVLQTLVDKRGQFSSFTNDLALLSDTLVSSDKDIRRLFDEGTSSARLVKNVVRENNQNLQSIFNDLNTVTASVDEFHKGIEVISILFPYLIHGSFTATDQTDPDDPDSWAGKIGLILESPVPNPATPGSDTQQDTACLWENGGADAEGYRERREPNQLGDMDVDLGTDCLNDQKVPFNPRFVEFYKNGANDPITHPF
ncbi:MAG TPA: MlaD family protein, partial [Acidimicrobiia bacterium]|nr:MlaD family protein [Acidimicrobiia bacterium]